MAFNEVLIWIEITWIIGVICENCYVPVFLYHVGKMARQYGGLLHTVGIPGRTFPNFAEGSRRSRLDHACYIQILHVVFCWKHDVEAGVFVRTVGAKKVGLWIEIQHALLVIWFRKLLWLELEHQIMSTIAIELSMPAPINSHQPTAYMSVFYWTLLELGLINLTDLCVWHVFWAVIYFGFQLLVKLNWFPTSSSKS